MPFLSREGVELHYEIIDGIVPADTIFLHGNLASNNWWRPAMDVLRQKSGGREKGRAILAEWRGCGKSSGPGAEKDLAPEVLGADYNALVEHLGIAPCRLVGHSTGGLIGLVAMIQKPELYSRAVLLDSVSHKGIQFPPEMFAAFTRMSQDRAFCEAIIMGTVYQPTIDATLREQLIADAFGVHPHVWHGVPRVLGQVNITADLTKATQPILVLHGEFDTLLSKDQSKELASLLPHGRFYEIPGRGHSPNVEDPELFVKLASEFLYS